MIRGSLLIAVLVFWGGVTSAEAQIGELVSPGPLSKAHASLAGIENCAKCHEPGKRVTADRCLACHKPIAERIAKKIGVHREVAGDCESCHVEHAGRDADIRPLDPATFNHRAETGVALDGKHAAVATNCAKCHKTRSFLTASPTCQSCHKDPHQGSLGLTCDRCHSTAMAFADARTRFDHSVAAFQLAGAHRTVACAKCHVDRRYKGVRFATCSDCHSDPHEPRMAQVCTTCHNTDAWKTTRIDHARTKFPLKGKHATVACASCHKQSAVKVALDGSRCTACHTDVHRGNFKQACETCHDERGFARTPFDHGKQTKFALTGKHVEIPCAKCHPRTSGKGATPPVVDFRGRSPACSTCHTDTHRGELGTQCERCHGTATFKVPTYEHPRFAEFFGGQHAGVACARCHVKRPPQAPQRAGMAVDGWTFKSLPTTCTTCHTDVHLGQVGTDCTTCHTIAAAKFAPVGFSHERAAFALAGRHKTIECRACHKRETGRFPAGAGEAVRLKGLATACASCHKDPHLGQLGSKCELCHGPAQFKLDRYTHLHEGAADFHAAAHAGLKCSECHKVEKGVFPSGPGTAVRYSGLGTACARCHEDAHQGQLGSTCEGCHTPTEWRTSSRAFHKVGVFPLEGRHLAVPCASCHVRGAIKGTPIRCFDCHWVRRQDDPYRTRLGAECEQCHRPIGWTAVRFNHAVATGVPLSAIHQALGCEGCHRSRTFERGGVTCFQCHRADYERAANPNHAASGFPTSCDACHRASHTSWNQAVFDHNASFPLAGVHATQPCQVCHKGNVYRGTPRDCIGCHRGDYDRTQNPNHAAAGFPIDCVACHQPSAPTWNTTFNHNAFFPLSGVHASQTCQACHRNNVYRGTPRDCVGCHRANYDRTQNPNHAAAGFPTDCAACHQPSAPTWNTTFNHSAVFPLVGVHASQACQACHRNNVYRGTPRDCVGCHRANYDRTQNPNHAAAGFPTDCAACHQPSAPTWNTTFNHSAVFPLVGVHASQACQACHRNNVYRGTPRDCVGCHRANYDRTQNPNHAAAGFSTACELCHQASAPNWRTSFNHDAIFQLQGLHRTAACSSCHRNNVYRGTPRDCYSCHQARYDQTTNPNHRAAGFPTSCETCHRASDTAWNQGRFNHTWFPIASGRHAGNPCSACHQDPNNYRTFTCVTCHGRSNTDSRHTGVAGYRYDSAACYSCHPQGRTG